MNKAKKVLVQFKKPRSIYDYMNRQLRPKYNVTNKKDEIRLYKRLKKTNIYDPEVTNEQPKESITPAKAKLMYKMFNDFQNMHRLSRKPMPKEEKAEYIKKCKEFSLFRANLFRKERAEFDNLDDHEIEVFRSATLLPMNLMLEILDEDEDVEEPAEEEVLYKEDGEDNEFVEYDPLYLYGLQALRIFPDDYHTIMKTMLNVSSYMKVKKTGEQGVEGEDLEEVSATPGGPPQEGKGHGPGERPPNRE
jgi:hypothetical protein